MPLHTALRLIQVLALVVLGLAVFMLFIGYFNAGTVAVPPTAPEPSGSPSDPGIIPTRIRIPALQIDAPVIPVGIKKSGQMEVPVQAAEVGWYAPGARPGNVGSAVLSGHLDTLIGTRGVFWNLEKIATGNDVYLDSASGVTLRFRVVDSRQYLADQAPITDIFSASGGQFMNLITCSGTWAWPTYDKRLVVFTQLVDSDKGE